MNEYLNHFFHFQKEWVMDPPPFILNQMEEKLQHAIYDLNAKYLIQAKKIQSQFIQLANELNKIDLERTEEITKIMQTRR